MEKIEKKAIFWKCSVCGTEHTKKSRVRACESMPVEEQKFQVGDKVTNLTPRICWDDKPYRFEGKICKVIGPEPPDEEYWIKWLGGLPGKHVFSYEVTYTCPICGDEKGAMYYAPELERVK